MQKEHKLAFLLALAAILAGVALMAAPIYLGVSQSTAAYWFFGGVILAALLFAAALGVATDFQLSRAKQMWPQIMMWTGAFLFTFGTFFYVNHLRKPKATTCSTAPLLEQRPDDNYAWALAINRINADQTRVGNKYFFQYHLILSNSLDKPVRYQVDKLLIGDVEYKHFNTQGGIIGRLKDGQFSIPSGELPPKGENDMYKSTLEVKYTYGSPDKCFRRANQRVVVEVYPGSGAVKYSNLTDPSDEAIEPQSW